MTRDYLSELEDRAEELGERKPAPPPERPLYAAGTTGNPAETVRLAYRDVPPAKCAHPREQYVRDARRAILVCGACGFEMNDVIALGLFKP